MISAALKKGQARYHAMKYGSNNISSKESFYCLTDRDMDGNDVSMSKYAGSVLCVVNVASK